MILAGDIGGTKTLLGLFDQVTGRPQELAVRAFSTLDFVDLPSMITTFLNEVSRIPGPLGTAGMPGVIDAACFGVAGPVVGDSATLTKVGWRVESRRIASSFRVGRVLLLNDLHAMACSVPVLHEAELHVLQEGEALPGGNIALIAAGTGLGEALLHNIDGRFIPSPSEGGHADFAARTERDIALLKDLTSRYGRAEVEQVVAGIGLVNIHRALHGARCQAGVNFEDTGAPAASSAAAVTGRCGGCVESLEVFVEAYGAEAGNLALRSVSTGGVFIGGGIAPKILPSLDAGSFMRAFSAKTPLASMLERMPVKVILNPEAALLGAAVYGAGG